MPDYIQLIIAAPLGSQLSYVLYPPRTGVARFLRLVLMKVTVTPFDRNKS